MLIVSSPKLGSGSLWLWQNNYWLRVHVDFNFRLLYDNLWSHDRNIDFDFRLLNHHLGSYDFHDRDVDFYLGYIDQNLLISNGKFTYDYETVNFGSWATTVPCGPELCENPAWYPLYTIFAFSSGVT